MSIDDIMKLLQQCGFGTLADHPIMTENMMRFAALVAAEKEQQMIRDGWRKCAEGQRTTQFCGLLEEAVRAEREACAKLCEEKQTYSMPISCPDGISGCCVNHVVPARREKTGTECAAAIRARGEA